MPLGNVEPPGTRPFSDPTGDPSGATTPAIDRPASPRQQPPAPVGRLRRPFRGLFRPRRRRLVPPRPATGIDQGRPRGQAGRPGRDARSARPEHDDPGGRTRPASRAGWPVASGGPRRPVVLTVTLLLGGLVIPGVTASADASRIPPAFGNRSGEPWLSGANGDPLITPADVNAFCAFRGSLCDVAQVYVARDSWQSIVGQSFVFTNFTGWPGLLVISMPPFPETGASLQTCATGAYDDYWRRFGKTLNATGRQNSIIRLAWEANGNWYPWSGSNPAAYISCYRHIVDAVRSTANPDPRFDWTINSHRSQNPPSHNPLDLYPGDQWVDIVSIDAYDHFPPSYTLDQFNAQADAPGGITWLYTFARTRGKLFGVPEWGVTSGSGEDSGGDNADYIQFMRDWMAARAGHGMYYESYFNTCEMQNIGSNIHRPTGPHCLYQNTAAAARYAQLW